MGGTDRRQWIVPICRSLLCLGPKQHQQVAVLLKSRFMGTIWLQERSPVRQQGATPLISHGLTDLIRRVRARGLALQADDGATSSHRTSNRRKAKRSSRSHSISTM